MQIDYNVLLNDDGNFNTLNEMEVMLQTVYPLHFLKRNISYPDKDFVGPCS